MSHRTDGAEAWALELLNAIVNCDKRNRDALPGSVVKKVKEARQILIKLKKRAQKESGRYDNDRCFYRKNLVLESIYLLRLSRRPDKSSGMTLFSGT